VRRKQPREEPPRCPDGPPLGGWKAREAWPHLYHQKKDRPPTLTESPSRELKSELLADSSSQSLMLVVVSGEMARGGSMGLGEDASKVWGHAMSCGWRRAV
jgi:hypothetical protein